MFGRLGSAMFKTQQNGSLKFNYLEKMYLHSSCAYIIKQTDETKLWMHRPKIYCTATINDTEIDAKILNVINTKNVNELQVYGLSQPNAKKIVNHRGQNGPYTSVGEMFSIKGFTTKHLEILLRSIFENEHIHDQDLVQNKVTNIIRKRGQYELILKKGVSWIRPKLPSNMTHVDKLLGLHFSEGVVSWALVNRDYEILEWNYGSLPNESSASCNYENVTKTAELIDRIPNTDVYIVEENGQSRTRRKRVHCGHQLEAVYVMAALAIKTGTFSSARNNIFTLKAKSTAQFFDLIVGSEIVSTDYVMPMLLYGCDKKLNKQSILPPIRMQSTIQQLYEQKKRIEQEFMNWSLLKTLTFLYILNSINCKDGIASNCNRWQRV